MSCYPAGSLPGYPGSLSLAETFSWEFSQANLIRLYGRFGEGGVEHAIYGH